VTAQARESILYKGEENWMATEPLDQYLHNRNEIEFVSPCSACWRGYYGKWEIRIPQGDLLEYVHMSYDSTFDKDLLLQFDQGIEL
jgi:hypothetical protein